MKRIAWALTAAAMLIAATPAANADPIADFYRGKTLRMLIGYGPGGGYDLYGRLVAEFLPRHHPRQSDDRAAEHAGRRQLRRRQVHGRGRAQGRHRVRQPRADAGARQHDQHHRQARRHQVPLSRPGGDQYRHRRDAAEERHQVVRGRARRSNTSSAPPAAARRRCCSRRRSTPMAAPSSSWCAAIKGTTDIMLAMERGEVDIVGAYGLPGILVSQPGWVDQGRGDVPLPGRAQAASAAAERADAARACDQRRRPRSSARGRLAPASSAARS